MSELWQNIPQIKRARAYRLYDFSGRRYVDLFQNNGYALLGHKPARLTGILKQVCAKGLIYDMPSIYSRRLNKALRSLFPGYKCFRISACLERALEMISVFTKKALTKPEIRDPLINNFKNEKPAIYYWRPFCNLPAVADILIPIIPFSVGDAPAIVCFKKRLPSEFPASDMLSPLLLAGATRTIYDLIQYQKPAWYRDDLLKGAKAWVQKGIYILANFEAKYYSKVFHTFLAQGYIISPFFPGPSILPAQASLGELRKMIKLFQTNP